MCIAERKLCINSLNNLNENILQASGRCAPQAGSICKFTTT